MVLGWSIHELSTRKITHMEISTSTCTIPGLIKLPQQITDSRRNVLHHGKPHIINLGLLIEDALKFNNKDKSKQINCDHKAPTKNIKRIAINGRPEEKGKADKILHQNKVLNGVAHKKKLSPLKKLVLQERLKKKETNASPNLQSNTNEDKQPTPILIQTLAELMSKMVLKQAITTLTIIAIKTNEQKKEIDVTLKNEQKLEASKSKKVSKKKKSKKPQPPGGGPALKSLAEFLTADSLKILPSNPNSSRHHHVTKRVSADRPLDPALAEGNRLSLIKRRALASLPRGPPSISCDGMRTRSPHSLLESYLLENYDHVLMADDQLTLPPSFPLTLAPDCPPLAISCWRAFLLGCAERVKENTHKKKFRGYCDHYPDPDITRGVKDVLTTLLNFYRRKLEENPEKARNPEKKRFVFGLKEILKLMSVDKIKCVVMATDIEPAPRPGGLDQLVKNVIDEAKVKNIPIVYGIRRDGLSKLYNNRRINISAVGILNYQGAEAKYRQLITFVEASRIRYRDDFCSALVIQIKLELKSK